MKSYSYLVALGLAVASVSAQAAITTYGTRALFDAGAGPTTTETFEACTGGEGVVGTLSASSLGPCSSLAAGISFSPDPDFDLYIASPGQSTNATTALGVNLPTGGNNRIAFAGGSNAFAADFNQNFGGGGQGDPAMFTVDAYDMFGALLSQSFFMVDPDTTVFFGLTSTDLLGSVWVRQAGGYAVIDNVSFTGGGVVPEPASWAMLIAGFGLVGAVARRRAAALQTVNT